ncbi:phospholipid:diacylglycerol acyltransferase 1-like [Spinacia oleracea]|uniref:Phospholipid:diacylglycerol acyltransferase 1-like n=1 Tax=Spinacia oleracea TaxID=3562 RepID=A0ABM3QHI4_SPIOL|nr:phospholipid:diacylglycerol acyltransferase 1-like [Spinacia oleracea]
MKTLMQKYTIDTMADSSDECSCLKGGVYNVNGDETVPVLSAGYMCAKAWKGKTRFNPSGMQTFIREYDHAPPANLLEGRGTQESLAIRKATVTEKNTQWKVM